MPLFLIYDMIEDKNIKKEKQYILVLREPDQEPRIMARGSESFVAAERTKLSFEYSVDNLVIEEEDNEAEVNGVTLAVLSVLVSMIILRIYGKKRK